ncbi:neuroendocrine convertase 2-like [Plakobranchus ocellatus]|uniref:Neuroendocrine convertase 2-like n=1 Tax=Plakobranchus ocellatus TaxID=259542 RepID=A0AAV3Y731_9GAST|nr:neuroendocrine convertase 2-like [Plakobranchus ocellatus]
MFGPWTSKTVTPSSSTIFAFLHLVLVVSLWTPTGAELESWIDKGGGGGLGYGRQEKEKRDDAGRYLNAFAIKLKEGERRDSAERIAFEYGFRLKAELPHSEIFVLERPGSRSRSKRSAERHLDSLLKDPRIEHAQQEVLLRRAKRRIVHDKQLELPIRTIPDSSLYKRIQVAPSLAQRDNVYGRSRGTANFKDPLFKDMWYLVNEGQSGGERGLDLNVGVVWENGITGKGVVVCILDDGVDHTHPDLKDNYDEIAIVLPLYHFHICPCPQISSASMPELPMWTCHGTRCAGEIAAAANNDICGVGVAYESRIGGVRVLDGPVSDSLEAEAISFNRDYIDIYSASWGPTDDGSTMEGPRHLALTALVNGVRKGRKGLGSIFVWATGNGGLYGDDCSADGYVSRPETLSVGSVNDWGRSPFFMENCTSTLAVVPSGGEDYKGQEEERGEVKLKVVTTDMSGGCIENFQGTSSAAPLATGCIANVLQANPNLTWRDVQHIVVQGTRIPSVDTSWTINGAGRHVSHKFGFGLLDCGRMVELAQNWDPVPEQMVCNMTRQSYRPLMYKGMVTESIMSDGCLQGHSGSDKEFAASAIDRLEHVQLYIKMASNMRGETAIHLVSPAGTRSALLSPRPLDDHSGAWEFVFMTVHSWDESPRGKWTLEVHHVPQQNHSKRSSRNFVFDEDLEILKRNLGREKNQRSGKGNEIVGYIKEWSIAMYGTRGTRHTHAGLVKNRNQFAYQPSSTDVAEIKKRETELGQEVKVKRAQPQDQRTVGVSQQTEVVQKKNSQAVKENLIEKLWDLLHAHGGRDVRKRVMLNAEMAESQKKINRAVKLRELTILTEKLLAKLDRRSAVQFS